MDRTQRNGCFSPITSLIFSGLFRLAAKLSNAMIKASSRRIKEKNKNK